MKKDDRRKKYMGDDLRTQFEEALDEPSLKTHPHEFFWNEIIENELYQIVNYTEGSYWVRAALGSNDYESHKNKQSEIDALNETSNLPKFFPLVKQISLKTRDGKCAAACFKLDSDFTRSIQESVWRMGAGICCQNENP